ncbi:MAG TPA: HEAT repeat domain-containing protein [Polyangia bacterium]
MEHYERAFLDELKYCIGRNDMIKAAAVFQSFPEISAKSQRKVLYEIFKAPDAIAFPLLEHLSRVPVNSPEIKDKLAELTYEKAYNNAARIIDYLRSKDTRNKGFYVAIAGNLKIREALPSLEEILFNATDERLLLEIITAVGKIGDSSSASSVAPFLGSDSNKLRLAAINALADIGGASAIKKLCETLTGRSDTDLAVIGTLARIQDHQSLEKLAELLSSRFADLRNAAIDRLVTIGAKAIPFVLDCLKSSDDDTVIHSLNILGNIGDLTALPAIVKLIYNEPKNPNVRYAVYEAMERLPSNKSAVSLAQGLTDPVSHVSMAAAKAIDKNLSTILVAGLRNMIEAEDAQSTDVVATLLDSGADNVFDVLMDSEVFQTYAVKHLAERAHPDIVRHCLELLKKKGLEPLVSQIQSKLKPEGAGDVRIMAVDDSRTMLKIYMRMVHDMGFDIDAQEFPAKALVAAKADKPDLLITDLNMPAMNGVQLSREIRKVYSSQQLPILMITTQSDIIGQAMSGKEAGSEDVLQKAGINLVLNKPFEAADLKNAINRLLKR